MLAQRIALEGRVVVAHTYSHIGIRCKYRGSQRPGIIKYPISALDQFGARIVAGEEKGCGELDAIAIVKKFIHNPNSCRAIDQSYLLHTLSAD